MTQPTWDQNQPGNASQGHPGMPGGVPGVRPDDPWGTGQPGVQPGAYQGYQGYSTSQYPGQPPMYVDAYGRPVYPPVKVPTPPQNPALGIWSTIVAGAGTVLCLVSFIWLVGQIEQAVRTGATDGSLIVQSFFGGFALMQSLAGLSLIAALVLGIIATVTNRGRGWGIGGIVGSVVGPSIAAYIGLMWLGQKAVEWSDAVQSSFAA